MEINKQPTVIVKRAKQIRHILNDHFEGDLDLRSSLVDLLTNCLHFAVSQGINFDEALAMARDHHAVEQGEAL